MKTASLRSPLTAAAMLLASLGALVAAQPAKAQHTGVYVQTVPAPGMADHDRFDRRHYRRDQRAPVISDVTPQQGDRVGERGWTRIGARITDAGSGIDLNSVVLRIDGRDVSHRARVDADEVRYRDDLRPGRHFAELTVRDRAGNATRRTWWFDVVDDRYDRHDGRYGWGYGR
jgi:hypothetical protein